MLLSVMLRDAVGSVLIILKGVNFGPGVFKGDPFSCAMLSWSARPDKAAPADPQPDRTPTTTTALQISHTPLSFMGRA